MKRTLFWFVLLALSFLSCFLLYSGYAYYTETALLAKEGKVAKVHLDAKEFKKNKGGQLDYFLYYFSPGAALRTEEKVDEATYHKYETGQEIEIIYVASSPPKARLQAGGLSYRRAYFRIASAIVLLLGLISYIWSAYKRQA